MPNYHVTFENGTEVVVYASSKEEAKRAAIRRRRARGKSNVAVKSVR